MRDLPDKTRKKIFLYHYIDPDRETAPQFEKILKITTNITISERRMQEFIKKRENDKMNELVDKYDRKSLTVKKKEVHCLYRRSRCRRAIYPIKLSSHRKTHGGSDPKYIGFDTSNQGHYL